MKTIMLLLMFGGVAMANTNPEEVRAEMLAIGKKADLWPGFTPKEIPLAVFDGSKTWLFDHPKPPKGFARVKDGVFTMDGRHELVVANSNAEMGGVGVATLVKTALFMSGTDAAALALHEAFHVFLRKNHESWSANEAVVFTYPTGSAPLLESKRLEFTALARALTTTDNEQRTCWTTKALEMRDYRVKRMTEEDIAYERKSELNEGLARYIQAKAGGGTPDLMEAVALTPDDFRQGTYYSGAAWALLLDHFLPEWRNELEKNDSKSLDELLAAHVTPKKGCDFTPIEKTEAKMSAQADTIFMRRQYIDKVRNLRKVTGYKILIKTSGEPFKVAGFDPMNVTLIDGKTVYHRRYIKLENTNGYLEMMDLEGLTFTDGDHPVFQGVTGLEVYGLEDRPEVSEAGNSKVKVSTKGFTLNFQNADAAWSDNELRIVVR